MTQRTYVSAAAKVMDEAVELAIEGRSPYPDQALFLDADPLLPDDTIKSAFAEGLAVVLVAADGDTRVLRPDEATRRAS